MQLTTDCRIVCARPVLAFFGGGGPKQDLIRAPPHGSRISRARGGGGSRILERVGVGGRT